MLLLQIFSKKRVHHGFETCCVLQAMEYNQGSLCIFCLKSIQGMYVEGKVEGGKFAGKEK